MLARSHWISELRDVRAQSFARRRLERAEVRAQLTGERIVPLAELLSELQQPRESVRTFETRAPFAAQVRDFLRDILWRDALRERFACGFRERRLREGG